MAHIILQAALSAPVATDGTITFAYPSGYDADDISPLTSGAKMWIEGHETLIDQGAETFTMAYGGTAVATYKGETTIPGGTVVKLQAPIRDFSLVESLTQGTIADLTEDGGAIGGTNDGAIAELDPTALVGDSDNTELLADVAVLRAAIRELAARSNEHNEVLKNTGLVARE